MALKPQGSNILAGTSLAVAQIQSPDFVTGVSGWCIYQNGNAEFNAGTFRGYIVGGSLFLYNGTPGVGTLVASSTPLTADPFGNTTQPGGFTVYDGTAYVQLHINSLLGPALEQVTGVTSEAAHGAFYNVVVNKGLANEIIESNWLGPGSTSGGVQGLAQLVSAAADGSTLAGGVIYNLVSGVATNFAHWNYEGFSIDAGTVTAAKPGTGTSDANPATAESWHTLSLTTVAGSGNGVNGFRYKLLAVNCLLLEWDLATNSVGNAVTIATLPAGWRPAKAHNIASGSYGGSTALTTGANPHFTVNTNGTIVTGGFAGIAFSVCGTALIGMD